MVEQITFSARLAVSWTLFSLHFMVLATLFVLLVFLIVTDLLFEFRNVHEMLIESVNWNRTLTPSGTLRPTFIISVTVHLTTNLSKLNAHCILFDKDNPTPISCSK